MDPLIRYLILKFGILMIDLRNFLFYFRNLVINLTKSNFNIKTMFEILEKI